MDSYLNLLTESSKDFNWDETQFASPPEQQSLGEESLVEENPASSKGKKKAKGKNFSTEEDNLLVRAWLENSQDATRGTDQRRSTYWQRIHDQFHAHKTFHSERNLNSLAHRWGVIQESVSRFCGWYTQIQNRNQSGFSEQDKVQEACALYQKNDPHNKPFTLMHCWNLLRNAPKWIDQFDNISNPKKKSKTSYNASPSSCTHGSNENQHDDEEDGPSHTSPMKRPDGTKKEKARRGKNPNFHGETLYLEAIENLHKAREKADELKEIKKKERNDQRIAIETRRLELLQKSEDRRLELEEKKLEMKQKAEDDKVMSLDLSGMSERQRKYYENLQDEIIARRFASRQVEK